MQMRLLDVLHAMERTTIKFKFSLCSKRFRASSSRTLGREQKKKGMTREGEEEGNVVSSSPFLLRLPPFFSLAPALTFAQ